MPFDFWETPEGRDLRGLPRLTPPLWKPVYQAPQVVMEPGAGGTVQSQPISAQYLLSLASAYYLATIYGATVSEKTFVDPGPAVSSAVEYWLNWTDYSNPNKPVPFDLNAGALAYYYCPAGGTPAEGAVSNPTIAVIECMAAINAARLDALRLVR
jgi:hypothetical protein